MCIRILDPLELSSNSRQESMDENERSMNYRSISGWRRYGYVMDS